MTQAFLYLHILGVGMLLTVLFASPFFERAIRTGTAADAVGIHGLLNRIGLLSPAATLILLLTGIGNIVSNHIDLAGTRWLQVKLLFYLLLLVVGAVNGPFLRRRLALYRSQAESLTGQRAASIAAFNRRESLFLAWQWVLTLIILALSILR